MTSKNNSLEAWILHHESASVASFWTSEGIFFSSRNFAHLKPVVRFTIELHDHYGKNIFWSLWHHFIRLHFTSIILRMHKRLKELRYQWKIRFRGFIRRWRCRDCDIDRERNRAAVIISFISTFSLPDAHVDFQGQQENFKQLRGGFSWCFVRRILIITRWLQWSKPDRISMNILS